MTLLSARLLTIEKGRCNPWKTVGESRNKHISFLQILNCPSEEFFLDLSVSGAGIKTGATPSWFRFRSKFECRIGASSSYD